MKRRVPILYLIFLLVLIFSIQKSSAQKSLLHEFAKQKNAGWTLEKRKADSLANILNIPIYYAEKDSNKIVILQRLGRNNKPVYYSTDNIEAAETISVDKVWSSDNAYPSLTGEGIEINLWDGGSIRATHQELQNGPGSRITMRDLELPLSSHSTHIAGTMIASGVNPTAKGMAGKAAIKAWDLNNDIAEISGAAAEGIVVSNHSYGPLCGWDYNSNNESWYWYGDPDISATEDYEFGFYNQVSADLDYIAQLAPNYLIVKSAGNDRGETPSTYEHYVWDETWKLVNVERDPDGGADGFDCLTPMAVAKNIFTVGSVDNSKAITSFSAFGPTDDGRIKPDVVTNGFDIYSSSSSADDSFISYSGTSMSAASATGSVALLNQLQDLLQPGAQLLSSTIKGVLIHTASDLGNTGPDYSFGWGLLNIKEAADLMYDNSHNQGKNIYEEELQNDGEIIISVTTQSAPFLRVTVCWTDPAGQASSPSLNSRTNKLVNDLDVLLENSNSLETFKPWVLNVENPGAVATQNTNHVDNVEQIYIANPGDNDFSIKITHSGLLSGGSQKFSLIISGIETIPNIFPPKNLSYTINESSILLNWDPPDSSTPELYKIYRNASLLDVTENTSFTDQSIVLDNAYEYYVTAEYELNSEKFESIETNQITVFPQTLRPLPFIVNFEKTTEILIKNSLDGWQWGDSESLNCYYLDFSDNTTKFIGADSYSAGDATHVSDIAITAPLRLADYDNIMLSFDYLLKTGIYDAIDELHVVYKLQEEEEWHELKKLDTSFDWTHHSFELAPDMCRNGIQIGFYYDDFYQWGMGAGLDNIQITGTLNIQEDISLETINSPISPMCFNTDPSTLTVEIKNKGNTIIPTGELIEVNTSCNNIQKTINYVLQQNLLPNTDMQISFENMIDYLPVGEHTLTVEVNWQKDQNLTNNSQSKAITINSLPQITFINLPEKLCKNDDSIILNASPEGGTFSGPFIVDNVFDLLNANIGFHEISYFYEDANACANSETTTIEVLPLPEVSFTGLLPQYCSNEESTLLIGSPSGGTFTGVGIIDNYFDPAISGPGDFAIEYTYTDQYSCSNSILKETYVQPQTALTIIGLEDAYCKDTDPFLLTGLPEGGTFCVNGIEQIYFNPSQITSISPEITYEFFDENGCISTISKSVTINELSELSIQGLEEKLCMEDLSISVTGLPEGGVFSGFHLDENNFNPIVAGIGIHQIIYTFEDENGCSNSETITVEVLPLPDVSFTGLLPQYCSIGEPTLLIGNPSGGTFTGDGITDNFFDPAISGPGSFTLEYTYTDQYSCSSTTFQETYVQPPIALSIVGLEDAYCKDYNPILLTGLPEGGAFYVDGIVQTYLFPGQNLTGISEISYQYVDKIGCISAINESVNILSLPEVTIEGVDEMYCQLDLDISPIGFPEGGVFTLEGKSVTYFNPIELVDGNYELLYEYESLDGCNGTSTQPFNITSNPSVSILNIKPSYCPNEASVMLVGAPEGGYFEGDGIFNNVFSPSELLPDQYNITYHYDLNGCQASTTETIQITEPTYVSIVGLLPEYCKEDSLLNIVGNPAGGVFTTSPIFNENPDFKSYDLFYTYTDEFNCTFTDTEVFSILPNPEVILPSGLELSELDTITIKLENSEQSFIWSDDSTSKTFQLIGSELPPGENSIYLNVQNDKGCVDAYELFFYVDGITKINDLPSESELVVYPNPADNYLNLSLPISIHDNSNLRVSIIPLNGKVIDVKEGFSIFENKIILDVHELPSGVYLMTIANETNFYKAKFIVNR